MNEAILTVGARLGQFEVRQGGPSELGEAHPTVTRHAAAGDARGGHLLGAQLSNLGESSLNAQLFAAAGDVNGDVVPHLIPLELVDQVVGSEATISDTTKPAPISRHSCRKGRSVTPAIGARSVLPFI